MNLFLFLFFKQLKHSELKQQKSFTNELKLKAVTVIPYLGLYHRIEGQGKAVELHEGLTRPLCGLEGWTLIPDSWCSTSV